MKNWLLRNRAFLVFVPIVLAFMAYGLKELPLYVVAAWLLAGALAWTLIEWTAHRAMHAPLKNSRLSRVQDAVHLRHHREPDDLEHSVVRLTASTPIAAVLLAAARLALQDWPSAMLWTAGVLAGYLFYEFVHLSSHGRPRPRLLRWLHCYHLRHHFHRTDRGYGVTSPLWDWVFGTLPDRHDTLARFDVEAEGVRTRH